MSAMQSLRFEGLEQSGFTVTTMRWIEDYDQAFEEGEQEYAEEFRQKTKSKELVRFYEPDEQSI